MISRTNISVLIATLLLAMLLWTVLGIVSEFGKIPAERAAPPSNETAQPARVNISNRVELEAALAEFSTDNAARIESYRDWMLSRGFPESYVFWSLEPAATDAQYAVRDDLSLIALAGSGNTVAMHTLAARRLQEDPLDALTWYDQAIANGSIYAMLKTADLLEMIVDDQVQELFSNAQWQAARATLNQQDTLPLEKALAWSIAAVTIGGYAILDHQQAGRFDRLRSQLDANALRTACDTAQNYVLETAAAIRSRGGTVFSLEQPPLALTIPNPTAKNPCKFPVPPLINFADCTAHDVLAPNTQPASLWICPYSAA